MTKVGILGMGGMGKLYANQLSKAGYDVLVADKKENARSLQDMYKGNPRVRIFPGEDVSRMSDLVFYLMEIENLNGVAAAYGKYMKEGSVMSSGSSVMTPAIKAVEEHMPGYVDNVNMHCLFGPKVDDLSHQFGAVVDYRSSDGNYEISKEVFKSVVPNLVEIKGVEIKGENLEPFQHHDKIMADVQTGTHLAFESIGSAWKNAGFYPWEDRSYVSGIDNVKALITMRIFSGPYHVYGGLAIHNPYAGSHVEQYAKSVHEIHDMFRNKEKEKLRDRIMDARDFLFEKNHSMIGLEDKVMREYSLGAIPPEKKRPNSHLSQLALVDATRRLDVNPYNNMICKTPPFTLRLGVSEYLMWNVDLLNESLDAGFRDAKIQEQDKIFDDAVSEWAFIIKNRGMRAYQTEFESVKKFFGKERIDEAVILTNELIRRLGEGRA
jgi:prephenate dehydrogenase (NADP+)